MVCSILHTSSAVLIWHWAPCTKHFMALALTFAQLHNWWRVDIWQIFGGRCFFRFDSGGVGVLSLTTGTGVAVSGFIFLLLALSSVRLLTWDKTVWQMIPKWCDTHKCLHFSLRRSWISVWTSVRIICYTCSPWASGGVCFHSNQTLYLADFANQLIPLWNQQCCFI